MPVRLHPARPRPRTWVTGVPESTWHIADPATGHVLVGCADTGRAARSTATPATIRPTAGRTWSAGDAATQPSPAPHPFRPAARAALLDTVVQHRFAGWDDQTGVIRPDTDPDEETPAHETTPGTGRSGVGHRTCASTNTAWRRRAHRERGRAAAEH